MTAPQYWAVIPAAGVGRRMRREGIADIPKQYLEIHGRTLLELTVERIDQLDCLTSIVLVLGEQDSIWPTLNITTRTSLVTAIGGAERADSVYNGLLALAGNADDHDWVLVHDVVRPCVNRSDLGSLLAELADDPVGGLLVSPVRETLKRVDQSGIVSATVPREEYRLAATPQMFRYGLLKAALEKARVEKTLSTDEAHAMERAGHAVKTVPGGTDNIKITHPEDLLLAEYILDRQHHE